MKTYIGIDLGGTNVRVAKVDEAGNLLQVVKEPTEVKLGTEHVMNKIIRMIESIDGYEEVEGIGMGVPGPVNTREGKMVMATNLPGFQDYPIAATISNHFNKPAYVDNDVNVACMGEALLGAGKDKNSCYYVTISTGIGGALVVDRKVVSGKNGHAGEVGNIIVDRNREKINHLNAGAIENEASGTALTRKARAVFGEDKINHAGDLFDLARAGNAEAMKIIDTAAYDLAVMFSVIAHVADPDIFVLGGGVMKGKDVFFDKMEAHFRSMIHAGMQSIEFKEVELAEPGIVGAAMLVKAYN